MAFDFATFGGTTAPPSAGGTPPSTPAKPGGFDFATFGAPAAPEDKGGGVIDYAKSVGARVWQGQKKAADKITGDVKDAGTAIANADTGVVGTFVEKPALIGRAVTRATGEVVKSAFDPIAVPIGDLIKKIADNVSDIPAVQRFAMGDAVGKVLHKIEDTGLSLKQIADKHPDLAKDVDAISNIALTVLGEKPAQAAIEGAAKITRTAAGATVDIARSGGEILANAGEKAAGTLKAPFKSAFDAEAADAFARQGVEAPASALTKSKAVQTIEANAQSSIFGGTKVTDIVNRARDAIFNITEKLRKDVNPDRLITPGASADAAGKTLKEAVEKARTSFNDTKSELYDTAAKQIGKQQAKFDNTRSTLEAIIAEKTRSLDPTARAEARFYQQMLNGTRTAERRTFETIKQTRTDIGKKLRNRTDPITTGDIGNLKRLYGALSEDLDATVRESGPAAAEALDKATEFYKAGIGRINSFVGRTIFNAKSPELIIGKLIKPGDASTVREIKALVGDEAFHTMSSAFMNKVIADAIVPLTGRVSAAKLSAIIARYGDDFLREILGDRGLEELKELRKSAIVEDILDRGTKDGKVMPSALAHAIESYSDKVLKDAFTPEELRKLKDVKTMSSSMARGTKIAEGSPTAEKADMTLNVVLGVVKLPVLLSKIGVQYGLTKLVTSKLGKDFLTKGLGQSRRELERHSYTTSKTASTQAAKPEIGNMAESVPQADESVKGGGEIFRYSEKKAEGTPQRSPAKKKKGSDKLPD